MMETESRRRQQAAQEMGLTGNDDIHEEIVAEKAYAQEEERRQRIEESTSFKMIRGIAKAMDKWFLDPIIGIFPVVGDVLSSLMTIPFIYVSLCKVRSVPLTLAVISNMLADLLLGMLPYWVGNVIDIFYRSNLKNFRLISGYVEGDEKIIAKVNRRAVGMAILILVLIGLIVLVAWLVVKFIGWGIGLLSN